MGASLASIGMQQKDEAFKTLGEAAKQENERMNFNTTLERERKAGNVQLGGTLGAIGGMALGAEYGSAAGPWGALIGGAAGAIAGGLF
jgi:uncharacterized protein YcfJ